MKSYRQRGWFGESYRHYLARKGIPTRYRYFQKGNFSRSPEESVLHSLWAQGLTNEEIKASYPGLSAFMGPKKGYPKLIEAPSQPYLPRREEPFIPSSIEAGMPVPGEEPLPEVPPIVVGQENVIPEPEVLLPLSLPEGIDNLEVL